MTFLSQDEIPSDEGNPFCSVRQLLDIGESFGDIATAIETVGIYTWDRFDRYRKYSVGSAEVRQCLNFLASELELRKSGFDVSDIRENFEDELEDFGWAASALPAKQASSVQSSSNVPAVLKPKEKMTLLLIISALLNEAGIPPDRTAASTIARYADQNGVIVTAETVRKVLKEAGDARQRRLP